MKAILVGHLDDWLLIKVALKYSQCVSFGLLLIASQPCQCVRSVTLYSYSLICCNDLVDILHSESLLT
jgi:hypothetical protein